MDRDARDWRKDQPRIISAVNVLLGLWLVAAPFVLGYNDITESTINSIVVGLLIVGLALLRLLRPRAMTWPSWFNVVLGLWLLGSPWIVDDGDATLVANNWIIGLTIIVLAIWSGVSATRPAQREDRYQEMT